MSDPTSIAERIKEIIEKNDLTASTFAEKINVGRSSISHILSGRNKPSLDFILNVMKEFPDVDLYWLMNGQKAKASKEIKSTSAPIINNSLFDQDVVKEQSVSKDEEKNEITALPSSVNSQKLGKNIQKVILLFSDGSFESYEP